MLQQQTKSIPEYIFDRSLRPLIEFAAIGITIVLDLDLLIAAVLRRIFSKARFAERSQDQSKRCWSQILFESCR